MRILYIKTSIESSAYAVNGLGLLSAISKKYGNESYWVNVAVTPLDRVSRMINDIKPKVVAITCTSDSYPNAVRAAQVSKSNGNNGNSPIVFVGGVHPTLCPEDFVKEDHFDYVLKGEGEMFWEMLMHGQVVELDKISEGIHPDNLDALPFIDRNQEIDFYANSETPPFLIRLFGKPWKCVFARHECGYNCNFCKPGTDLIFGKLKRSRSVANVIDELNSIGEIGSLFIHDDNLLEDAEWCDEFSEKWCGKPFMIQARPDLIVRKEKLLRKMAKSGLRALLIGFESASDRILKLMNKGFTQETNDEAVKICYNLGIMMQSNFIFASPTEEKEDVISTLRWIKKNNLTVLSVSLYTPFPCTKWEEWCKREGWDLCRKNYDYSRGIETGKIHLKEEALGYTYEWLLEKIKNETNLVIPAFREIRV